MIATETLSEKDRGSVLKKSCVCATVAVPFGRIYTVKYVFWLNYVSTCFYHPVLRPSTPSPQSITQNRAAARRSEAST